MLGLRSDQLGGAEKDAGIGELEVLGMRKSRGRRRERKGKN